MSSVTFLVLVAIGVGVWFVWLFVKGAKQGYREAKERQTGRQVPGPGERMLDHHGGAAWANGKAVLASGHGEIGAAFFHPGGGDGAFLGALSGPSHWKQADVTGPNGEGIGLVFREPGHVLTVAGTRAGKGVYHIVNNLAVYRGSAVVVDIKGELFALTGEGRHEFGPVYDFGPFVEGSARFNPLDLLTGGPGDWDTSRLIIEMLTADLDAAAEAGNFWGNEARSLLVGLVAHVAATCERGKRRDLLEVRRLLMQPWSGGLEETARAMLEGDNETAKRAGAALLQKSNDERSGVISTAQSLTSVLDSPRLGFLLSASDFDLSDFKKGSGIEGESATLYLNIPPEHLRTFRPVLRLMLGLVLTASMQEKAAPALPVLVLVDEFPALGAMRPISEGVAYLAGYGVRLWLFAQNLAQLRQLYGQGAETLLANCAAKVFFGVDDPGTARMISDALGSETVPAWSFNAEGEANKSYVGKPLLSPHEVMTLGKGNAIAFMRGMSPAILNLLPYFNNPTIDHKVGKWSG